MADSTHILPMGPDHAVQVAALHRDGIHTGFLSTLGPRFLTQLYAAIPSTQCGFGYVAVRQGRVVGFIACGERLGGIYKQALRARGMRMAWAMVPRVFRPSVFKRVLETLVLPARMEDTFPAAEVLSIVAAPEARGSGVAADLMRRAFDEFRRRGIPHVKVQVFAGNAAAKRFYEKCGFVLAGQKQHHENMLDVYVIDLTPADGEQDVAETANPEA
ncbi:MAG: GNAT family N-acetyltransferase [Planctomycetes bacterium]|nr:GNAT family N-acetyltransferase [Planctomycetota bacterium]